MGKVIRSNEMLVDLLDGERPETLELIRAEFKDLVLREAAYWLKDPSRVEDVGQETFLRLFQTIRDGKLKARTLGEVGAFLKLTAKRIAENLNRSAPSRRELSVDRVPEGDAPSTVVDDIRAAELRDQIESGLLTRGVDPLVIKIWMMRVFEHFDYREIERRTGVKPSTASSMLTRHKSVFRKVVCEVLEITEQVAQAD